MLQCRFHVTRDANITPHIDADDLHGSVIFWVHGTSMDPSPTSMTGGFYLYDLGLWLRPERLTLLYIRTDLIVHGSQAPDQPKPPHRFGVAMCNNQQNMSRTNNQVAGEGQLISWVSGTTPFL
jgi:hypothetical protein